jgi:prephenate dehydrogenase
VQIIGIREIDVNIQLVIIGLGQIGSSLGLALAEHSQFVDRTGYDIDRKTADEAKKIGAVDRTVSRLNEAVRGADVILLALPVDQLRDIMEVVSKEMPKGAVLMDTAPIKGKVAAWAEELLPEGNSYVGLTPVVNPKYLHSDETGIHAAREDLFRDGLIAISTPPNTDSKAIKLAADFVRLVGAFPFFADLMEIDGLMTATHVVPQIMAAALINATVDRPGWQEARKLAGRAYAEVSGPVVHLGDPSALTSTVLLNRENVLRVLDSVIASMQTLREDIYEENSETLIDRLERAHHGREHWWRERKEAHWPFEGRPEIKSSFASDVFSNLLRGGRKPRLDKDRKT